MKVRVSYVVDVNDDYRRGIRFYHGQSGLATRQEVKDWHRLHGMSLDDDLSLELERADEEEEE